ncbi:SAP domain-containing protein [Thomasclavelia sp.]|uniref:SAP domain-containing protein n=1 Tax=Thomasclavelia sp. TaxID=3025757 RepID=UPI0025EDB826|nr:SAP domain-containing protein [Thomasclavelia sp.]
MKKEAKELINELTNDISNNIKNIKVSVTINSNVNANCNSININNVNENLKKAIFLYTQNRTKIRQNHEYQQYLHYKYNIINPREYHKSMINEGYFELTSIQDVLNTLKVKELKDVLNKNNLEQKGRKKDLIERIINNLNEQELNYFLSKNDLYCLSIKGKNFIELYKDYILLHKHSSLQIEIEEYETERIKYTDVDFYIIAENILRKKLKNDNYNVFSTICNNLYKLYYEQEKYDQSLFYLLLEFYYDLNGMYNYQFFKLHIDKKELLKEKEWIDFIFTTGILENLIDLKVYYKDELLDVIYQEYKLPINCCPYDLFKKIISDLFNKEKFNEKLYKRLLRKNYVAFVKSFEL